MDKKSKANPNPREDKSSDKYKVSLKLINKILVNIGKDEIDDLTKFTDIDRVDIIKEVNMNMLTEMENELFQYFDKECLAWYRRKTVKYYILTFLRCMCIDLGFKFTHHDRRIQNNAFIKTIQLYSIR